MLKFLPFLWFLLLFSWCKSTHNNVTSTFLTKARKKKSKIYTFNSLFKVWGLPFYWSKGVASSTKYSLQRHFQVLIGYSLALFLEEPNLWNATDAFQKSRTQPSDEDQQGGAVGIAHLLSQSEAEEPRADGWLWRSFRVRCDVCRHSRRWTCPLSCVGRRMSSRRLEPSDLCLGFGGSYVEETCLDDEPSRPASPATEEAWETKASDAVSFKWSWRTSSRGRLSGTLGWFYSQEGGNCCVFPQKSKTQTPEVYLLEGNNRGHLLSPSVGISQFFFSWKANYHFFFKKVNHWQQTNLWKSLGHFYTNFWTFSLCTGSHIQSEEIKSVCCRMLTYVALGLTELGLLVCLRTSLCDLLA